MTPAATSTRQILASRELNHVVVIGANGTMGFGSAALFTQAVPRVTFLARSREKAQEGLDAAVKQVRSSSLASRSDIGDYDTDLPNVLPTADLVFEAVAEDMDLKKAIFDKIEAHRRADSMVATVSSGLSINELAAGRSDSFRQNFCGLHFFNPPNVITGTELIANTDTDPAVLGSSRRSAASVLETRDGHTADTPAFAGNRVGFKVLNEAAQLATRYSRLWSMRLSGLTPVAGPHAARTIDLVGWDVHRAIVDNVYALTNDEAHETAAPRLHGDHDRQRHPRQQERCRVLQARRQARLVLDVASGDYVDPATIEMPDLSYVNRGRRYVRPEVATRRARHFDGHAGGNRDRSSP
ncbi:MAG: 3-hydroxyacyl-CoA dehydrogenase family protein [Acidimicrobiales bacterium]